MPPPTSSPPSLASAVGQRRAEIERVRPEVDCGKYPIKRVVGEEVTVECSAFVDGHDLISARLLFRVAGADEWSWKSMAGLPQDRWRGSFTVDALGRYQYTIEAHVDRFATWIRDLTKKVDAGQATPTDFEIGARLIEEATGNAPSIAAAKLRDYAGWLRSAENSPPRLDIARDPQLKQLMEQFLPRPYVSRYEKTLEVVVDRERARFGSWYELFPRSCTTSPTQHGTFNSVIERLPYVASLGFDVLYLPPIHPIGRSFRKGKNNATAAQAGDVGSPWAIGAAEGGHKAIHPELGTLDDFHRLVKAAASHGLELSLDLALQCSPEHPYVTEHPEWFRRRPDGSIQYAENPPKKYQDIYPFDFETEAWESLWFELKSIVEYWIEQGVINFRVDNPHTKPLGFWRWLIGEIKRDHPEVLFLSEAFTRPSLMYALAKVGFSQSYTYFTWRNSAREIREYCTGLMSDESRNVLRANFWANTPDILPQYLQTGGRAGFMARLMLAATLAANYGIYGPVFEQEDARPRERGSEEYLDSEKYEIRPWTPNPASPIAVMMSKLNQIRRENPALQRDDSLEFHDVDNDQIVFYSKRTPDNENVMLMAVNTNPFETQSGWLEVPLERWGMRPDRDYHVDELLSGDRFLLQGSRLRIELNPRYSPGRILRLHGGMRTEREFEYFF